MTGELPTSASKVFAVALADVEELVRNAPHVQSDQDLVEGLDYLGGLARSALQSGWADDRDLPRFIRQATPWTKVGLDNPDTLYLAADFDGSAEYVVRGTRGTTADLNFQVLAGAYSTDGVPASIAAFDDRAIDIGDDGSFELRFGPETGRDDRNYVSVPATASRLLARQTFSDWAEQPGILTLQRVDRAGHGPRPLDEAQVRGRYKRAAKILVGNVKAFFDFADRFYLSQPVNTMYAPRSTPGGLTSQFTSAGHYDLSEDEAMIVSVRASEAAYHGMQLGSMWYVSLDFINHQTSLTGHQARVDPDGMIRYVVSERDPGVANWLECLGHQRGYLQMRWQRTDRPITSAEGPTVEVVSFDELPKRLEFHEESAIDSDGWFRRIAARQHAVAVRMLG